MRWGCQCPAESFRYPCLDIIKVIPPGSSAGSSLFSIAALTLFWISSFDFPANTNFVLIKVIGSTVRAAGGLRQRGLRFLGLQNSGLSNELVHARSTTQTKPFLPSTAVS